MSAPDTNLEKQKRRHRGPLLGMALAVVFGLFVAFLWLTGTAEDSNPPGPDLTPAAGTADGGADPAVTTRP